VDPRNGNITFAEGVGSAGTPLLRLSAGYIYSSTNPYYLFDQSTNTATTPPNGYPASYFIPRDEVLLSAATQSGPYKASGYVRRNLTTGSLDAIGARTTYEDECFIFDVNLYKRYLSINGDHGGTTVLFQITLKTIGQFGYHAS
jgi:LPS-assembly protein